MGISQFVWRCGLVNGLLKCCFRLDLLSKAVIVVGVCDDGSFKAQHISEIIITCSVCSLASSFFNRSCVFVHQLYSLFLGNCQLCVPGNGGKLAVIPCFVSERRVVSTLSNSQLLLAEPSGIKTVNDCQRIFNAVFFAITLFFYLMMSGRVNMSFYLFGIWILPFLANSNAHH